MAILSSIFAWKIPWTEEPGGPQSMWLQRVSLTEHTRARTHTHTHTYYTEITNRVRPTSEAPQYQN